MTNISGCTICIQYSDLNKKYLNVYVQNIFTQEIMRCSRISNSVTHEVFPNYDYPLIKCNDGVYFQL